ncbi:saccharopine dehydrogenase [Algimonas ampicilliniresistens]|uniref:Saccharopine dehydrogenase n=1 Tax=Algimonas ampicilliniresistens TaxID=1298735 RepID=A0ABQ5VAY5_9PROT|nr:saccharopine dehydrogenase NADP-binding domain-containing protein [Algimonas ampicilliniresistens]GLQ24152.1 saccharopine dehydrogenase [Algimonas ampicilliniresistens]
MSDRDYEIVVYGSTGYTGRLVAEYLHKEYGDDLNWAMAGRSMEKLKAVRSEMGLPDSVDLIVADSSDPATLKAMCERADAVITTVGPYQLYGEPLVKACVETGTDYVDLCGEPAWMVDMIDRYSEAAAKSGARIVHSCGFDSIPFDMGVYLLQREAKAKHGKPYARVRGRVRKMQGTFSGGTAASFMETMKRAQKEPHILEWLKNPFSLAEGFQGPAQPTGHKPILDEDLNSWAAPFVMAAINTKNVHRSNALMGHAYGEDFTYDEMVMTGPGEKGEAAANFVAKQDTFGKNPPKPGEGPTSEEREAGFYDLAFIGGTKDSGGADTMVAVVTGDKDPGYGSTSKMISEAALCLTRDVDRKTTPGGVYTSAPAMGTALIERLEAHAGLTFRIEG